MRKLIIPVLLLFAAYHFLFTGLPLAKGKTMQAGPAGYANPIGRLTPYRIDQGVDYNGPGSLYALGSGKIVNILTGWPGYFIALRLSSGRYAGRYVYYAEDISPAVRAGDDVHAGQLIAAVPSCMHCVEIGWAAAPGGGPTLAREQGQTAAGDAAGDAGAYPTRDGVDFSNLIASLGGPRGYTYGRPVQG